MFVERSEMINVQKLLSIQTHTHTHTHTYRQRHLSGPVKLIIITQWYNAASIRFLPYVGRSSVASWNGFPPLLRDPELTFRGEGN